MGCSYSQSVNLSQVHATQQLGDESYTGSRYWFPQPSEDDVRHIVEKEGLFRGESEQSLLELRALLDYPLARDALVAFSANAPPNVRTCLHGWLAIQAFKTMKFDHPETSVVAQTINKKYVQGSPTVPSALQTTVCEAVKSLIELTVFDAVQSCFYDVVHAQLFLFFQATPAYEDMCTNLRRKYNRVKQNDFWYHQLIGQGGFGIVCEVSKKSTGVRYAMKLLRKDHLMQVFGNEPWRVEMEKRAFVSCRHPFIVELHFSFQTESLVAMVMSLGTGRDLSKSLMSHGTLTIEQVTFYAAEITSSLSYLHHKGLVYRDLKPANIMLDMDGHIKLIDFGSVGDVRGKIHAQQAADHNSSVFMVRSAPSCDEFPLTSFWDTDKNREIIEDNYKDMPAISGQSITGRDDLDTCSTMLDRARNIYCIADTTASASDYQLCIGSSSSDLYSAHNSHLSSYIGGFSLSHSHGGGTVGSNPGKSMTDMCLMKQQCFASPATVRALKRKFYELSDVTIMCHLLACDCDLIKTTMHIEQMLLWRQSYFTSTSMPIDQSISPGCCFFSHGYDSEGHPLVIFTSRLLNRKRNYDELLRWLVFMFEHALQKMPPDLAQVTILVNRLGYKRRVDLHLAQMAFPMAANNYPGRVSKVLFYPVSMALQATGGILKAMAGSNAHSLHFVKSLDQLREYIPNRYIPVELGGVCNYEFNINDYPPPTVCEPYQYCLQNCLQQCIQQGQSQALTQTPAQVPTPRGGTLSARIRAGGGILAFATASETSGKGTVKGGASRLQPQPQPRRSVEMEGRAKSIVGSYGYMAPEMIILMVNAAGFTHTGYTKAVDWWSLGVTIYRLLTGLRPFKTDIPKPTSAEERITEGSDRYSALLERVDYSMLVNSPDVIDFISKLLRVDDSRRLGFGPNGSTDVSAHRFFRTINWVELEKKQTQPPPLPVNWSSHAASPYSVGLDMMLQAYKMDDWITSPGIGESSSSMRQQQRRQLDALNNELKLWDYASPAAIVTELESTKLHTDTTPC